MNDRRADDNKVRKMKRNETDTWYGLHGACVSKPSPLDDPLVDNCFRELFTTSRNIHVNIRSCVPKACIPI
eukprot:12342604-Ditylum_brightwellii.AAC.1